MAVANLNDTNHIFNQIFSFSLPIPSSFIKVDIARSYFKFCVYGDTQMHLFNDFNSTNYTTITLSSNFNVYSGINHIKFSYTYPYIYILTSSQTVLQLDIEQQVIIGSSPASNLYSRINEMEYSNQLLVF